MKKSFNRCFQKMTFLSIFLDSGLGQLPTLNELFGPSAFVPVSIWQDQQIWVQFCLCSCQLYALGTLVFSSVMMVTGHSGLGRPYTTTLKQEAQQCVVSKRWGKR